LISALIFDDEKFGWVAETKGDDGSINHYGLESARNESDMDRMIAQYSAEYGIAQEDTRFRGAWDLHRERIIRKLASKAAMLRRLGCYPEGLDTATARLVANTMCDAISVDSSEIWQLGAEEARIESALNVVHRRILGAEAKTATVGTCTSRIGRCESEVEGQRGGFEV